MYDTDRPEQATESPRSRLGGGRTVASSVARAPEDPLLQQIYRRLNECRQRVLDMSATVGLAADSLVGAAPEPDTNEGRRGVPCGGVLGEICDEVSSLEMSITRLETQATRLRGIA